MIDDTLLKRINLEINDGLSAYNNMAAQQHHNAFSIFYNFLQISKPNQILEIGTALGGFTEFIFTSAQKIGLNIQLKSYDIHKNSWYDDFIKLGIDVSVKNIFDSQYKTLIDDSIISFIQQPGLTIVMCDGGCKKCEFNILSQYIKNDDIIMAHDYAPNTEYFEQNMNRKIWNWHEIQDSDLIDSINKYNLIKNYNYDELLSVAWGCFRKQ